jgi:hypothetical protein
MVTNSATGRGPAICRKNEGLLSCSPKIPPENGGYRETGPLPRIRDGVYSCGPPPLSGRFAIFLSSLTPGNDDALGPTLHTTQQLG